MFAIFVFIICFHLHCIRFPARFISPHFSIVLEIIFVIEYTYLHVHVWLCPAANRYICICVFLRLRSRNESDQSLLFASIQFLQSSKSLSNSIWLITPFFVTFVIREHPRFESISSHLSVILGFTHWVIQGRLLELIIC